MASKLAVPVALVSLLCLGLAPSAFAARGLAGQRVVTQPERTARTATINPLIAPATVCPDQSTLTAPVAVQEEAMRCMTDFARTSAGLGELTDAEELDRSARDKAEDVLRCDSFSHFACGREFTYWIREAGYIGEGCWHAGENLAWGSGEYGSVGAIFRAWMNSPTHRQNILGDYSQVGLSLVTGDLEGHAAAHVWAAHFGSRCEG
jgi:uncharacterized protein YkwD